MHIENKALVLHSLFWMSWVVSFTIVQTIGEGLHSWSLWLMYYLITLPVFISHTYLIAYYVLPRTFFKGRYVYFAAATLLLLLFFSVIELLLSNYLVFALFDKSKMFAPGFLNLKNIVISGIGNHYIILVFMAIKAGGAWYRAENEKEQLQRTKQETELEIYRFQLQPRMVLSLMDELKSIAQQEPDKAPEMIVQISNFLNGFVASTREELIPLKTEVRLLEDFLSIHKPMLDSRLSVNFIVNGNLNPYVVPPLLLLPFINSAIKIIYNCNENFESNVIIKAERNYLLLSFTFWSENPFSVNDSQNSNITRERLDYVFHGKYRMLENVDDNFKEISIEIFAKV